MMMGVRYGSNDAVQLTRSWLGRLQHAAYIASVNLARAKTPFPLYDRMPGLAGFNCRSNALVLTAFCSSPVNFARLSVNVSAIRNCIRPVPPQAPLSG